MNYEALVIGVSAGGLEALTQIIPELPSDFPIPVVIVPHRKHTRGDYLVDYFAKRCQLKVMCAEPGQAIQKGFVYIAPSGYHLLIEQQYTFSLSIDNRVNYSIPSIDVLFESAAMCYQDKLIGLILTGANNDGSLGLKMINYYNGLSLVQDPETAEYATMPNSAINTSTIDFILPLTDIPVFLTTLLMSKQDETPSM